MAEFVVKIKLQLENLGIGTATASSGRPATPVSAPASTAASEAPKNIEETRQAFSGLSADVKAFAQAISQVGDELTKLRQFVADISSIKPSTGNTASATSAASAGASREAASASKAETEATKEKTKAEQEATEATKASTEASKAKADAEKAETEATKKAAAEAAAAARNLGSVGNILSELHKRAQQVSGPGGTPPAAPPDPSFSSRIGGQLSPAALFADVLNPIAVNREFRAKAALVNDSFKDLFDFDERGLDTAQQEAAEKARNAIRAVLRSMTASIDKDPSSTDAALKRGQAAIRKITGDLKENTGINSTFNSGALSERATARGLVNANADAQRALEEFAKALASGAEESVLSPLEHAFTATIENMKQAVALELGRGGKAFVTQSPQGQTNNIGIRAAQEIESRGGGIQLNAFQQKIVNTVTSLIKSAQPLDAVRAAFKLFAEDIDNFEDNMRLVSETLSKTGQSAVGGVEGFKKLQEALGFLKIRRDSKGRITGSGAAVGEAESAFNVSEISKARQALAGRRVGSSTVLNQTVTDESGNIRKVQVALTQLGGTFDTVSVKAKALSDNMFDRASVRTALQRVAVWGAAAGLIFGAVSAFKNAVDTVVKTEAAIFTLAKVMDEAQSDFSGFVQKATEAGIAIAQKFGQPLQEVIQTMILFSQQGLTFPEVKSLTEASALAANVTTLDQPTAASALTAATEQFGVATTDATAIVDKFNNVANNAAVTETQLAEALKRSGSAAVNAGVSLDEFNGIVAAISEQTRQGGSEIGNALKFIFSRLNTPEAEKGLARVGVAVRDAQGNIRPFADLVGELAGKFDTLTSAQRNQVAIAVSGSHRFNTFLALLKNFDEFQASTANSVNSAGSAMREQEKITTTAAFKLTQLKNAASATAISFGGVLSPVLKIAADTGKVFLDVISKIPDSVKILGTSVAAAGVIFTKFSQQAISVIDLFDKSSTGGKGLFGALAGSLASGITQTDQRKLSPEFDSLKASRPGVVAARAVGDFSGLSLTKGADNAKKFAEELKLANLQLVDSSGKAVKGAEGFTKFSASVRGFKVKEIGKDVEATALGLSALNSPIAKIAGSFVILSNGVLRAASSFLTLGVASKLDVFGRLEGGISKINPQMATLVGGLLRVAGATALIFGLVKGFQLIRDVVGETGETVKASLQSEIAKRQEVLAAVQKQREGLVSLDKASSRLAQVSIKDATTNPILRDESIRLGAFKSPLLEQQRFNETQRRTSNNIGLNNPELISGFDEFGNVVLKGVDAFDKLSASIDSTQKSLLALTKIKVIEGFIKDLEPASGGKAFFGAITRGIGAVIDILPGISGTFEDVGKTAGDKFKESLSEMEGAVQDFRSVLSRELGGVDLKLIDEDFANTFDEQSKKFQENALDFRRVIDTIRSEIKTLPEDTGELLLRSKRVVDFTNLEARKLTSETGRETSGGQVRQQLFLQNRKSFKGGFAENIGLSGEETLARFNEKGILQKVLDVRGNVQEALSNLKGGELVITSLLGDDAQLEVVVNEFGERLAKSIDEVTGKIKLRPLAEVIKKNNLGTLSVLDPRAFKEQIDRSLLELERTVSGAGRGSILSKDIDIGPNRSFDLTGQQRLSFKNENLFADALKAQKELETVTDQFKNLGDEVENVGKATTETVITFQKLSNQSDTLNTIIRFGQEIENVGKAFEQAIDQIQSDRISDAIKAQFSGLLGAGRGTLTAGFQTPALQSEVAGAARFGEAANALIEAGNALSRSEVAQGGRVAGLTNANRIFDIFTRDLASASAAGGVRDPNTLSQLAESSSSLLSKGLGEATALQQASAEQQIQLATDQLSVLQQILDVSKGQIDPALLGAQLAEITSSASGTGQRDAVAQRIAGLDEATVSGFSTQSLGKIVQNLGQASPTNVTEALLRKNSQNVIGTLSNDLIGIATRKDQGTEGEGAQLAALNKINETQKKSSELQNLIFGAIKPFASDILAKGGGATSVGDEAVKNIGLNVGNQIIKAGEGADNDRITEIGERIVEGVRSGNQEVLNVIRSALSSASNIAVSNANKPPEDLKRSAEEEKKIQQGLNKALIASELATKKVIEPLLLTVGALNRLQESLGNFDKAISDSLIGAASRINASRNLGGLASSTQSGALRGTFDPSFSLPKLINEFSGADLTKEQNQGLITSGNDLQNALSGVNSAITEASNAEIQLQEIRREAISRGDIETAKAAEDGLSKVGDAIRLLQSRGESAADTLDAFGQSLSNIQAANDLFVGVRDSLKGLDSQLSQLFDTTSIDTALGRGPFAFTRPTFDQFQQGQGGRLTASERAEEDLNFKQRTGQIGFQELQTGRKQIEFNRNEEIIAAAQAQENRKFELETETAKGIRGQLGTFIQKGGPGADQARALFDQLTQELEEAGDIIKTSVGDRTIRNPLTGQDERVPASDILQFKGVSSLDTILQDVQSLSQDVQNEEQQKNAGLINKPIVDTLSSTAQETHRLLADVVSAIKESPSVKGAADESGARDSLSSLKDEVLSLKTGNNSTGQTAALLNAVQNGVLQALDQFGSKAVSQAADKSQVVGTDGVAASFVETIKQLTDIVPASAKPQVEQLVASLTQGSEAFQKVNTESTALVTSFTGLSTVLPTVVTGFNSLLQALANFSAQGGSKTPPAPEQKLATGGLIRGPGGPTSDRVKINASPGEFVVKASTVRKMGVSALDALNAGVPPKRFNEGGEVVPYTEEEIRKAEELRRKRLLAVGIDPDSKAQTISINPPREELSKDERALEHANKLKGLADVTINSTRDAETLRGLLLDDVAAKVELARKGKGLRFGHAIPGMAVSFENGKPVFTNAGFDENGNFLRGPKDKIVRDPDGTLRRVADDGPDEGPFPIDSRTLGMNFENEGAFTKEFENREKLKRERDNRAEALKLKTKAVDLINKAQSNIFAEKTLASISSSLPGPTSQLNRQFNTALSNLTRVGVLSQTAEGRNQLDAELNPSQEGGSTLDKEINQSAATLAALGKKLASLQRGPINVFDQSTGGVRSVGEAYFGPGSSIDPYTGKIDGEVFSLSLANTIARFGSANIEELVAQAKGISGQRAGKFEFGLGGKFGDLAETVADTKHIPGALKLPINVVAAGASFVEDSTRGVADIGYGALKTAGNVVTGDFDAAGKSLKKTGKALAGLPRAALTTAVHTVRDTGQAAGAYGAGIVLSLRGDDDTAREAFSDAASKGFSATKGGLETYTAIAGGAQALKLGKRLAPNIPGVSKVAKVASSAKNKLATFKANRAAASEQVAKAKALKDIEKAAEAAKTAKGPAAASEVAAEVAKKPGFLRRLATSRTGIGVGADAVLQSLSQGLAVSHPTISTALSIAGHAAAGIGFGADALGFLSKGFGKAKSLFGKGRAAATVEEAAVAAKGPVFEFGGKKFASFEEAKAAATAARAPFVPGRFPKPDGSAFLQLPEQASTSAAGAFNPLARGGTSVRTGSFPSFDQNVLARSNRPVPALIESRGPLDIRSLTPDPVRLGHRATRRFNFSKLEAEKQRVLNTRGVERQITTASGEINTGGLGGAGPGGAGGSNIELSRNFKRQIARSEQFATKKLLQKIEDDLSTLSRVSGTGRQQFLKPAALRAFGDKLGDRFKLSTALPDLSDVNVGRRLFNIADDADLLHSGNLLDQVKFLKERARSGSEQLSPSELKSLDDFIEAADIVKRVKGKTGNFTISEIQEALRDRVPAGKGRRRQGKSTVAGGGGDPDKFAFGGIISGPGGPKSDQVPILASAGEFILNSDAVRKIGLSQLNLMNQSGTVPNSLPKFAEGGLVGAAAPAGGNVRVSIDSEEVSRKISGAITDAIKSTPISLDIPAKGVPIDTSGLNLGENLGSAVRNRLEAVEGSVAAIREDVTLLTERVEAQHNEIITEVFTMINEQISNIQGSEDVGARLDKNVVAVKADIGNLSTRVAEAIDIASRALSQALAR